MKTTLAVIQIILSLVLAALIFLQSNGDSESRSMNSVTTEKRGWEKVIFNFTIFCIVLFIISSIAQTLI